MFWIREPKQYTITDSLITIVSEPHTDLWQRTYYGIQQRQCSGAANENLQQVLFFYCKDIVQQFGPVRPTAVSQSILTVTIG